MTPYDSHEKTSAYQRVNDDFLSHLVVTMRAMASAFIDHAIELVEKANADLEVDHLDRDTARG